MHCRRILAMSPIFHMTDLSFRIMKGKTSVKENFMAPIMPFRLSKGLLNDTISLIKPCHYPRWLLPTGKISPMAFL